MPMRLQMPTAVIFVLLLVAIGAIDARLTRSAMLLPTTDGSMEVQKMNGQTGVAPTADPNVFAVIAHLRMATQTPHEQPLLGRIVPDTSRVIGRILLTQNDRVALFAFVQSPDVKAYFSALKDSLHASFSAKVQDLIDTQEAPAGKPIRSILAFKDPAISEERLLFLRVRDRLYEFHIAEGKDADVQRMVEALSE
ncbi:hypothetical protein HY285_05125 [Candidatus Peregrinibacteria bacterium]|nr:hypothetical protein [Candidatus Peregrinibacteria bacterium]MBI3816894.1 hypothetical protein [Candidatus Peregrinibacteria bacterium]